MLRIPVTSSDVDSARIKKTIALLRKHYPIGAAPVDAPSLSTVQNDFALLIGYGKYKEMLICARKLGPVYEGVAFPLAQVIEAVSARIAAQWSLPIDDAKTLASKLHLGSLDSCRSAARPFPPSALRDDRLSPAVHAATLGLPRMSVSDLVTLGAPGYSYAISENGDTFVWDKLVTAVDQLRPEVLEAMKLEPQYATLSDMSALRDAYVRDVLIPPSKKLLDAVRLKELAPLGYETISLFNAAGVFRGRTLINRQLRGLVPVISRDENGLSQALASLAGGRAPQHLNVRNLDAGEGKGRLISFDTETGGRIVHDFVDNQKPRMPGRTYVEYEGAEQMYALAPQAVHHEAEIGRLISAGQADLVKMEPVDLVVIPGVVLDDGRFPDDLMDIAPGAPTVDGQLRPRSVATDRLCGPSFYERKITYIRLHNWLTVDDIPHTVVSAMGIPNVKTERDHMLTEALPSYRTELHSELDRSVASAILQAQRMIASTSGTQKVLDLAQRHLSPEQAYVRFAQILTPVIIQRVSDQKLVAAGQRTKEVMPELDAYNDYVVGVALAMSSDGYSLNVPGAHDFRAKATLLSWLVIFSLQTAESARETARFSADARALLVGAILMDSLAIKEVVVEGQALTGFLNKLADQDRYILEAKKWNAGASRRWIDARRHGYWAVGAAVDATSRDVVKTPVSVAEPKKTFVVHEEAENQYRLELLP
ncbi:hypothetical protein ABH908_000326 [Pseudomonas frederiksbergensis]|uniref:hypothetical protein n=1 Tax=Pseudomonas TaxID=286 RepID=UPI003D1C9EE3